MHDINDLIEPAAGWVIRGARGINDAGQIAANGCNAQLECRALRLDPLPVVAQLVLSKTIVAGCLNVSATVVLSGIAPPGGVSVSISDGLPSAIPPASVLVRQGTMHKNFTIQTTPITSSQSGSVYATAGVTLSRSLTVRPIGVVRVMLTPSTVKGGTKASGTAQLECNAAPGQIVVNIKSANAVATPIPTKFTVPVGVKAVAFSITTKSVTKTKQSVITATANGVAASATLKVNR